MEKAQERALRFLLSNKTSSFAVLLEKDNSTTLHVRIIKAIEGEVIKSLNDLNARFIKVMFEKKAVPYNSKQFTFYISQL